MALVVGLIYYAIGDTFYISTLDWNGVSPFAEEVGAGNFAKMFADPVFWQSLTHTAVFFVCTFALQTLIGFTFAAILHTEVKLRTVHKVIVFLPTVLAPATMAPTFRLLFSDAGMLNDILRGIGLDKLAHPWLADPNTALPTIMLITVWQWTGMTFILYYASMSQIDSDILEAARLDGAGNFRVLSAIVWPSCRGTTTVMAILGFIGALKTFDVPWLVTVGGPNHATEFLGTYIYRQGIRNSHVGYAAAISLALLVLAVAGAILMTLNNRRQAK
ncbi:MAG: sugar ABC transporter permease [Bifidobacteriaceae bacterium]|jgi:raffinose/stachyose/melibiose transport system permease protein|nr:sugar ABC transporter permease [Bifidobacteriaceae bacterium]